MDTRLIKLIILSVIATFIAIYLGVAAATAQIEAILWVVGTSSFLFCLLLGRRIWLMIPFFGAVDLTLRLPGLPSTVLVSQIAVILFSILMFLVRKLPYQLVMTELEWWIVLIVLFVCQVYVRHPVGVHIFGGSSVGGKPYVMFAIALVASLVLIGLSVPPKELKTMVFLSIIGGLINLGVSVIAKFVPSLAFWTGASYNEGGEGSGGNTADDPMQATREGFVGTFARNLSLWISSYRSPLSSLFRPLWGTLILLSVAAAGMSGFRNAVVALSLTYMLGVMYRGGTASFLVSCLAGSLMVVIIAIINAMAPLPPNIQRSLSFLPGTWNKEVVSDAKKSTEWRTELWKEVLFTDRWIKNKLLGDGLGFTEQELQTQMSLSAQKGVVIGTSGFDLHRETILANADYHSGPVQTVRVIGYFGLIVMVAAMLRLAVHAHQQILRARGTEWYPVALFVCIPLIWYPVFWVFIFGDFVRGASTFMLGAAMVRMLQRNIPLPAYISARRLVQLPSNVWQGRRN